MAFSKAVRQVVYEKYGGRCAYCGRKIAYKDMQVDHFIAKRAWTESGTDDLSNLMPSCRMCNHYKRANSLETFRIYIREIPRKLRQNYIYKVGVVYEWLTCKDCPFCQASDMDDWCAIEDRSDKCPIKRFFEEE